jgi:hypothetical protein
MVLYCFSGKELPYFLCLHSFANIVQAEQTSWLIAPAIALFGMLLSHDLVLETSTILHLSQVMAAALALGHIHHLLFGNTKYNVVLWCLVVGSFPLIANVLLLSTAQTMITSRYDKYVTRHPIEDLIASARANNAARLKRQSRSYQSACDEYHRRYNIEPPPGFQDWYNFAVKHQSPVIDNFDIIMNSISPLQKLSGKAIIQAMSEARSTPGIELWTCAFTGSTGKLSCTHPTRSNDRHISLSLGKALSGVQGVMLDVSFFVNHLDEPRVLFPRSDSRESLDLNRTLNMLDLSHQSTWEAVTRHCSGDSTIHEREHSHSILDHVSGTTRNETSSKDLCAHHEYRHMHGMLSSPTSFKLIKGLVPVLSTGTLSTMGDILFPSPAYSEKQFEYHESQDMPWELKKNEVFWTGSTTGGYVHDNVDWKTVHRQRFVAWTQNVKKWAAAGILNKSVTEDDRAGLISQLVSYLVNKSLFNVSFTKIFQCDTEACKSQQSAFSISPPSAASRIYKSRLTFDLDGNGISGRFYSLLASHSLPLKQTILREWHDDRLVPWVHYIPISLGMEELQDVVWYFTLDKRGQQLAKEIAEEGREWYRKALREVDRDIYVYRLMLELARLQDPEREAM